MKTQRWTPVALRDLLNEKEAGATYKALAAKHGVSEARIYQMLLKAMRQRGSSPLPPPPAFEGLDPVIGRRLKSAGLTTPAEIAAAYKSSWVHGRTLPGQQGAVTVYLVGRRYDAEIAAWLKSLGLLD